MPERPPAERLGYYLLKYVPKEELTHFAQANRFPLPPPRCPKSLTSRRARMQAILRELESDHPGARSNLLRALWRAKISGR